jgi:hypothetical protein
VGDAVGGGDAAHGEGGFEVFRAVVEGWKEMVVEIDHWDEGSRKKE